MPLVSTKEILMDGRRRGYGVASLMGSDLGMVIGLVRAAEELRSPLLLVYNKDVNSSIPIELGMPMIANSARLARVPVATVLDHGFDMEIICRAIEYGASTVMFDGSGLPYEENIARTCEAVEYAHARGVTVEAELGSISGSAIDYQDAGPEARYTDPDVAVDFIAKTGVDFLAISFGNAHGIYHGVPKLDLDRVRAIYARVDIPLVMHGASGLDFSAYPKIIQAGITKVCYYTAMARGAAHDINACLQKAGGSAAYHDMINWSVDYHYRAGKELLTLFGSAGMA
jgi:fructose-bisphosphate aldolase class II